MFRHPFRILGSTGFRFRSIVNHPEDPIAFGDGIQTGITESLALIRDSAQLTSAGESLLARMIGLIQLASQQWNEIRRRLGSTSRNPFPARPGQDILVVGVDILDTTAKKRTARIVLD